MIFCDYYCGIFGYCSKHHIFKKYFLRVDCPFKSSSSQVSEKTDATDIHRIGPLVVSILKEDKLAD